LLSSSKESGGAAIACMRQARALEGTGHQVIVLAPEDWWPAGKLGRLAGWIFALRKHLLYKYYQLLRWKPGAMFSASPWPAADPARMRHPVLMEADVIVLHWINHGFMGDAELSVLADLGKPLLWHMHDQWAFTGGCHYSGDCTAYERSCGSCPQLRRSGPNDLSGIQFRSRHQWARQLGSRLALVAPSQWLADSAGKSGVLRGTGALVRCIPNPFDAEMDGHRVAPRLTANPRLIEGAGARPRIFFAAVNPSDPRKGWELLMLALGHLGRKGWLCDVEVAGKVTKGARRSVQALESVGHRVTWLGLLGGRAMQEAYVRADLFVIPSLQENFPNTILESFAAGTPVVGFAAGGIANMVVEARNGALAPVADPWDSAGSKAVAGINLASAIIRILNHPSPEELRRGAFDSLEAVRPDRVSKAYTDLVYSMLYELAPNS
jgi:glycosyltransferase involved in cell wall biosynthesis